MKLFKKITFLSLGLCVIATTSVLAITSCSSNNPYADYTTGASITIKSKGDAKNCDIIAKNFINIQPTEKVETQEEWNTKSISWLVRGAATNPDFAYASTQIYWELVHYMCSQYTKGTSSISLTGDNNSDGRCNFLANSLTNNKVTIKDGSSIVYNGTTYPSATAIAFGKPADTNSHPTLDLGTTDKIPSYGLSNITCDF